MKTIPLLAVILSLVSCANRSPELPTPVIWEPVMDEPDLSNMKAFTDVHHLLKNEE